ncbi:hypothetical protein [Pseudonocardia xishanensis]|uniref:Uncharacterized protein n=1 Tax=Pseudonocardia xishanensis TaxID=630995 RepID=A0ABP8RY84_9PSEU
MSTHIAVSLDFTSTVTVEPGPAGSTFYLRADGLTVAMTNEQLEQLAASAALILATDAVPAGGVR